MTNWQRFFDSHAPKYDAEVFTQNTAAEIPFIIEHLQPPAGGTILDLGCGTGRHSVPLAQQGYQVTGVDLSAGMLSQAAERARQANVQVEWVHENAEVFTRPDAFDVTICLCEGAMCLLGADDDPLDRDVRILENVRTSLRPGGRFMLNVLHAARMIRKATDADVAAGRFDLTNLTEVSDAPGLDSAPADQATLRERGYTAPELARMLRLAGFEVVGIHGGTAGDWGLRPPKLDEYELMAFARKPLE